MTLVSICIPTYNRPNDLRRAVESCLAQTFSDFEIVITDNSTNDESAKMAATWIDPRIRYYSNEGNIGPIDSTEKCMNLARGKYIKLLMDDDLLKPRCLELMVKGMEANPSAGIAMAPMDLIDEQDRRIYPRFYVFRKMHYRYRYQVGDGLIDRRRVMKDFLTRDYPCVVPSGIMYRKEALGAPIQLSREADFAGDLYVCMKLATMWDFYYVDEVLTSWRYVPGCHTAQLHREGLNVGVFYYVTRTALENKLVQEFFKDEWEKIKRDSYFFCSCRALLNGLAGLRARSPKLVLNTIKTIVREDPYPVNWLRLPLFVIQQIWISIFPAKLPPPRE
ncbi:MAG TPA: glycosyltransferase family 2 protein [Candidatus Saccharimonadales bacterium]|nr:glycosyltransferase family 2 protein [Candidatus Saccharimonadales bacterium]